MQFEYLEHEQQDGIAILSINRPEKRNAVNDGLVEDLQRFFSGPPGDTRVVILRGNGDHFCAGLDLAEHRDRSPLEVMHHSQFWHTTCNRMEFGGLPIVSVLHGAVIGGGMEIAMATHVRVAERSTFYELPEGRRGIFVGGGASVRLGKILGADRTREMMLTGRRYDAEEGRALGLSHYLVDGGAGMEQALKLAAVVASNAPASNYMMLNALSRIENMATQEGFFTESLAAALTQTSEHAREGMRAFLEKRAAKFGDES